MLWTLGAAVCVAAVASVALAFASDHLPEPGVRAALLDWVLIPYVVAGLVAWWRRPDSRFGPLMVAAGFAIFCSALQWSNWALPYTVGLASDLLPAVLFLHVFLAFPDGRLERLEERVLVGVGYGVAVGLQLVKMLIGGGEDNLLAVTTKVGAATALEHVQLVALSAVCLAGLGVLAVRRRRPGGRLRQPIALLVDSFALGLVMLALLLLAGRFGWSAFETIRRVTFGVVGLAPIAFLVGLLHVRLARSAVADLVVELKDEPSPAELRTILAQALHDPSLTVAYWLADFETWADAGGHAFDLPEQGPARATTLIAHDGVPMAALVHEASLETEPELLEAVSAAAGMALENGRLNAALHARLEELKGSRERVVEAGQKERQRLERNLHDGAQQRLIALSLDLRRLKDRLGDDAGARAVLDDARSEIARSLEELREVARGLHPAVVSAHGLPLALESLVARAPVPVTLTVDFDDRFDAQLEVAAYYVVSECLANIGKHSLATSGAVAVARNNGDLVVEVLDDGVGGADSERGSGIRGLADRVEALGGRLRVWSPRRGGTRVRAELPCA